MNTSGSQPTGKVLSIWGPAGAPGRTTVAVNLATEFTLAGHRVLLVDADTFGASVAARLGVIDEISGLAAACRLANLDQLDDEQLARITQSVEIKGRLLHVLSGIVNPRRWPELSTERMNRVFEFITPRCDLVIVDCGFSLEQDEEIMSDLYAPRRNAATLSALAQSDLVLSVTGCDQFELSRFLRHHSELVDLYPETSIHTLVNQLRASVVGVSPKAYVRHTLERYAGITNPSFIPWDPLWHDASIRQGIPIALLAPKSKTRGAYQELAESLMRKMQQTEEPARRVSAVEVLSE